MRETHLITGGTGFVGSAVILELLRQTDADVVAVVRPAGGSPRERLLEALGHAAAVYEADDELLEAIEVRCHAIGGDLGEPHCGVDPAALPPIRSVWHCAASLRYEDRYAREIFATNLDGTRQALALAERAGVSGSFNYLSTAYVAGSQHGLISERLHSGAIAQNQYEASKQRAERLVWSAEHLRPRILRPSIVIGHSRTHAVASGYSGMYGFIRTLSRFKRAMSRLREGMLDHEQLRLRIDPESLLNVIPVDIVADHAVRIDRAGADPGVFHLTNDCLMHTRRAIELLFSVLDLHPPAFAGVADGLSWLDQQIDKGITFYKSYLFGVKRFDRTNVRGVLGGEDRGAYPLDDATLKSLGGWYLAHLESAGRVGVCTR